MTAPTYEYDEEGIRVIREKTSDGSFTEYEWDYRNRLVKVTDKDSLAATTQIVEYSYDVFDRRISRVVDITSPFTMSDARIERYAYDDINGITSIDKSNVILDFVDPDGSDGVEDVALAKRYLFGNSVDQILAQEDITQGLSDGDRVIWPLADHIGSVRDMYFNDATVAEHYQFDSFGQVTDGDTSISRYLFTAREFDEITNLQLNRARYYDAGIGRWVSEDPLTFGAGDANLVRYAGNSPIVLTDPSGLLTVIVEPGDLPTTIIVPHGTTPPVIVYSPTRPGVYPPVTVIFLPPPPVWTPQPRPGSGGPLQPGRLPPTTQPPVYSTPRAPYPNTGLPPPTPIYPSTCLPPFQGPPDTPTTPYIFWDDSGWHSAPE